jgi:hypothetical protein
MQHVKMSTIQFGKLVSGSQKTEESLALGVVSVRPPWNWDRGFQ